MAEGEFIVGSEDCPFTKQAHIQLLGKSDSPYVVETENFGRKFIGVPAGGTLELHGKRKTSWTKLAQTIPSLENIPCAVVYKHSNYDNKIGLERQQGLHVLVWHEDGSVLDFVVLAVKDYPNFPEFLRTIPAGKVIGVYAFGTAGIGNRTSDGDYIRYIESAIKSLGGVAITSADIGDSYAFLVRKGDITSATESRVPSGQVGSGQYIHLTDWNRELDFQVAATSSILFDYFRVLSSGAAYPILTLASEVTGWEPGDQIVVVSTDFDWRQAEVRTLIPCSTCSRRQVRVNETFQYMHYGNFTYDVDERAEVGMLSRSILIEGVMEPACYYTNSIEKKLCARFGMDTFGGNIRIIRGHANAHIEGVELYHMGQQPLLSRYPLHFHMCDDVPGMYLKDNTVHDSFSRCITIHGTNKLLVQGNVCYKHLGHGVFIEDSVEQDNIIERNLIIGTMHGTRLMSDSTIEWCQEDYPNNNFGENCDHVSSFWLTHPNNVVNNNVAAGSDGHGFKFVFADLPLGPSYDRQAELGRPHYPMYYPIQSFADNTAHSNGQAGLFMDSKLSTGRLPEEKGVPENGVLMVQNGYDPRDPPTPDGQSVWTEMRRITFFKNGRQNAWLKGGNIRMTQCTLADSPQGLAGGTTGFETGTEVTNSIFIGETDNVGLPSSYKVDTSKYTSVKYDLDRSFPTTPYETLTGVSLYQGPNIVKNTYFNRFWNKILNNNWKDSNGLNLIRYGGGLSFKRSNAYPTMTSSYVQNITFGYCDGVDGGNWVFHGNASIADWEERDGSLGVFVRDADGSVTGTANASIVRNIPFYKGPECSDRPNWGMTVCPYRYVKMEILGDGGNLASDKRDKTPMIAKRDDAPYDEPFVIEGTIRNEYLFRTQKSYLIDFNTQVNKAAFPTEMSFYGYGVEKGDVVRIGVCQPLDAEGYWVRSDYPAVIKDNATWASSLEELDADTTGSVFFHDKQNGILFFKLLSLHQRTNDTQQCPSGLCNRVKFVLKSGSRDRMRSCFGISVPPFRDNTPKPDVPLPKPCPGIGSPQGLGALDWSKVDFVVRENFSVPCAQAPPAGNKNPTIKGCYTEKGNELLGNEVNELASSMTPRWCLTRCKGRGYTFAAVTRGKRCTCGNTLNDGAAQTLDMSRCTSLPCSGDVTQGCGDKGAILVLQTQQS
ncbi:protein DDB_G0287365-like isoform X2 [Pomacea canaliculata]|uniref:protein DDB_G0287365-like isoform X2 n=1 Tax=Pomacea canaliculata TaxID=400727 RepID=UPI000D7380E3|nr:protein DDB_G0287365-like isoform X2 [Pomacea canaliculata]